MYKCHCQVIILNCVTSIIFTHFWHNRVTGILKHVMTHTEVLVTRNCHFWEKVSFLGICQICHVIHYFNGEFNNSIFNTNGGQILKYWVNPFPSKKMNNRFGQRAWNSWLTNWLEIMAQNIVKVYIFGKKTYQTMF